MTMTKLIKRTIFAAVIAFFGVITPAYAQLEDVGEILKSGTQDANALLGNFLNPFGKGFGAGLNTGWFSTAGTHSTLGFDLSFNLGLASVPSGDNTFIFNNSDYSNLRLVSASNEVSTVSGGDNEATIEVYDFVDHDGNPATPDEEVILTEFDMPGGVDFGYVPAPVIQASVGLIKSTDLSVRFVPATEFGDFGTMNMIGFGVKHEIGQWIPVANKLPVDISLQFGYTKLSYDYDFELDPEVASGGNSDIANTYADSQWDGQGLEVEAEGYTINAIVGKKLPIIAAYAGLGYESSTTTVHTPGSYPITSVNPDWHPTTNPTVPELRVEAIDNPIDLEFEGANSFRGFAGLQLQLAVFKIFANYTVSTYSTVNAGFGITFR